MQTAQFISERNDLEGRYEANANLTLYDHISINRVHRRNDEELIVHNNGKRSYEWEVIKTTVTIPLSDQSACWARMARLTRIVLWILNDASNAACGT